MNFFSKYFVLSFFFCTMVFTLQPMFREYPMFGEWRNLDRSADTFGLIVEDTFLQHRTSLHNDNSIEHVEKPTIEGQIYITPYAHVLTALYTSKKYHEQLCQTGIHSWIQVPVIPVAVQMPNQITGITTDWVSMVPNPIIRFEIEKLCNGTGCYKSKKFPAFLPATLLYKAKTGTILCLTIHGYPTQLECVDSPQLNSPFENCYTDAMQHFLEKAFYHKCDDEIEDNNLINNFIKRGLLIQDDCKHPGHYKHGENKFENIEKLLCNRFRKTNKSGYFLLCLVHALPRLIKEAQDI